MSRFVFIALLAVVAITSARPYVVSYGPYYDYPYYSYPLTPVAYVETLPVTTIVSGPPPPVAALPVAPAKLTSKNARQTEAAAPPPPPPSSPPALPAPPPPPPPAPPAPPAAPPTKQITISLPNIDPSKLLEALPIQQLLELPPVKKIVELKTNKLEALMGLQTALQGKLQTLASLLP